MSRREPTPRAVFARSSAATRGTLSEAEWQDVLRASRIARKAGVTLMVHGIEVFGHVPKRANRTQTTKQQQQPAEPAKQQQPQPAKRSARRRTKAAQQRSATRLETFNAGKRKAQLCGSTRVQAFLRAFRRERVLRVHRQWQIRAKLRDLLWRAWTKPYGGYSCRDEFVIGCVRPRLDRISGIAPGEFTYRPDPAKPNGERRRLDDWLRRRVAPMEDDRGAKRSHESPPRPPNEPRSAAPSGKKTRGARQLEASLAAAAAGTPQPSG